MPLIARAMTSLIASDFSGEDLNQVLNAQLDSLAISPQAKQNIIPALLGIAKLTEVQSQGCVHTYSTLSHCKNLMSLFTYQHTHIDIIVTAARITRL
jgi:hypothetical protein